MKIISKFERFPKKNNWNQEKKHSLNILVLLLTGMKLVIVGSDLIKMVD